MAISVFDKTIFGIFVVLVFLASFVLYVIFDNNKIQDSAIGNEVSLFAGISAGLFVALFIAAEHRSLLRDFKDIEIQNNKKRMRYFVSVIQERNIFVRSNVLAIQKSKNPAPYLKEIIFKQFPLLIDEIRSVRNRLAVYDNADNDIDELKKQISAIIGFTRTSEYVLHSEDYEGIEKMTKMIEERCRWFTRNSLIGDSNFPEDTK